MAASVEISDGDHDAVELIVRDASASELVPDEINGDGAVLASEEITPLLKPKINIFSVSHSRRKPREKGAKLREIETFPVTQFVLWIWGGSRYSGLLCVAISSTIYFVLEVLSDFFSDMRLWDKTPAGRALSVLRVWKGIKSYLNFLAFSKTTDSIWSQNHAQSIPLFETAFARCTITLILSYLWLRGNEQPIFGPAHARKFLFSRALTGCFSLLSFIYCIQRLPLSQAIVLSFTTPIMASIVARIILHEKLKIADVGGLACSFFGVLFIFRQILTTQGALLRVGETNYIAIKGRNHVLTVLVALFSSITGGISYCLIKAGAKASDQPLATVFSFGILATPATGICTFAFEPKIPTLPWLPVTLQEFVLPNAYTFFLMLTLGLLSFSAEVFFAHGLQLEKTSKAANVLYMEVALSQIWRIGSRRITPSFGGLVGCLLILISVCCTLYFGPEKETE